MRQTAYLRTTEFTLGSPDCYVGRDHRRAPRTASHDMTIRRSGRFIIGHLEISRISFWFRDHVRSV